MCSSSHQRRSVVKGILKNFAKSTGKYLGQSLYFTKAAGLTATLLRKRLWHKCFSMNFTRLTTASMCVACKHERNLYCNIVFKMPL